MRIKTGNAKSETGYGGKFQLVVDVLAVDAYGRRNGDTKFKVGPKEWCHRV